MTLCYTIFQQNAYKESLDLFYKIQYYSLNAYCIIHFGSLKIRGRTAICYESNAYLANWNRIIRPERLPKKRPIWKKKYSKIEHSYLFRCDVLSHKLLARSHPSADDASCKIRKCGRIPIFSYHFPKWAFMEFKGSNQTNKR